VPLRRGVETPLFHRTYFHRENSKVKRPPLLANITPRSPPSTDLPARSPGCWDCDRPSWNPRSLAPPRPSPRLFALAPGPARSRAPALTEMKCPARRLRHRGSFLFGKKKMVPSLRRRARRGFHHQDSPPSRQRPLVGRIGSCRFYALNLFRSLFLRRVHGQ